jgi:hypothetical protein
VAPVVVFRRRALLKLRFMDTNQIPGNVQPETPLFKAPGDATIRAKEINNGKRGRGTAGMLDNSALAFL